MVDVGKTSGRKAIVIVLGLLFLALPVALVMRKDKVFRPRTA